MCKRVATVPASFGFTQWTAAVQQPPALRTIVPYITWNDPFNGVLFRDGALELGTAASWQMQTSLDVLMRRYRGDSQKLGQAIAMLAKEVDTLGTQGYRTVQGPCRAVYLLNDGGNAHCDRMQPGQSRPVTSGACHAGRV